MNRVPLDAVLATPEQAWALMDRDLILRLSLISPDMNEQLQADIRMLHAEARRKRNASYYAFARIHA